MEAREFAMLSLVASGRLSGWMARTVLSSVDILFGINLDLSLRKVLVNLEGVSEGHS
jgi:hypothetical protein